MVADETCPYVAAQGPTRGKFGQTTSPPVAALVIKLIVSRHMFNIHGPWLMVEEGKACCRTCGVGTASIPEPDIIWGSEALKSWPHTLTRCKLLTSTKTPTARALVKWVRLKRAESQLDLVQLNCLCFHSEQRVIVCLPCSFILGWGLLWTEASRALLLLVAQPNLPPREFMCSQIRSWTEIRNLNIDLKFLKHFKLPAGSH